jgi:hypothetical protein
MKPLTKAEKQAIVSRCFWDEEVDSDVLIRILNRASDTPASKLEIKFYRRLLSSTDWYTLLKLVPQKKLEQVLSEDVIDRLYPPDLKDRYRYARQVLHR